MNIFTSLLLALAGTASCLAGNLNVIHLGPPRDVEVEVKVGGNSQKFTLALGSATGPFMLPQKKGTLRTVGDETKAADIKAKAAGQIAVLQPEKDAFKWVFHESKPSPGKTGLRLINISDKPATVTIAGKPLEIKAGDDQAVTEVTSAPIRVTLPEHSKASTHELEEPSAVIGFIYLNNGEWNILYVNDV